MLATDVIEDGEPDTPAEKILSAISSVAVVVVALEDAEFCRSRPPRLQTLFRPACRDIIAIASVRMLFNVKIFEDSTGFCSAEAGKTTGVLTLILLVQYPIISAPIMIPIIDARTTSAISSLVSWIMRLWGVVSSGTETRSVDSIPQRQIK